MYGASAVDARDAISIHTLREEGDPGAAPADGRQNISIHALREEGDDHLFVDESHFYKFLSTPSARRATMRVTSSAHPTIYFYPRPPQGGRPGNQPDVIPVSSFLSTPSARRATDGFY